MEHLHGNEWDGTMNYFACARPIREFVGEIDLFQARKEELNFHLDKMTAKQLHQRIAQFYGKLPFIMQGNQFNLIDSHDVSRLHNKKDLSFDDYKTSVILYFTLPGTPSIYYGDELGINGRTEDVEGCRYPMPWNHGKEDSIFYRLYKEVAHIRTSKEALLYGGLQFISSENYVLAYARCYDLENIFVIASVDGNNRLVEIPYIYYGYQSVNSVKDLLGSDVNWQVVGPILRIIVPPHITYMLEFE